MQVVRTGEVAAERNNGEIFMGEVHSHMLVESMRLNLVKFSAGGRTRWHSHEYEQGLLIVEGKGIVATEAEEHVVEPGDVVYVPANEKHWHGGSDATAMAHVAINGAGETTVLEPVEHIRTQNV